MGMFGKSQHSSGALQVATEPTDEENARQNEQENVMVANDAESNAVIGDADGASIIDYKTLEWWQGSLVLIAETVSLGILSLPFTVAELGLVPGIISLLVLSALSTYSGLMLYEFWRKYPRVENFGDALEQIGKSCGLGALFQEIFGWAQVIFQIFVAASHVLTWTICMNNLTDDKVCTIVWAFVGLGVFGVLNLPRTLKYTSWMSAVSFVSITIATLMTVGNVASGRSVKVDNIQFFRPQKLTKAIVAVLNMGIAFSSHSCIFGVLQEFRKPEDFPKALALLQVVDTGLYLLTAITMYAYYGAGVPSPALSAAEPLTMRKGIWGVAIPTIVIAGVIYGHVAAKYIFVRFFRDTVHMKRRTLVSTASWFGIIFLIWLLSVIIAQSIPVFTSLLGVVAALFVSWFSFGLPGIFWLWMTYGSWFSGKRRMISFASNVMLVATGILLCVLGTWASAIEIHQEEKTKPWSCASNAHR